MTKRTIVATVFACSAALLAAGALARAAGRNRPGHATTPAASPAASLRLIDMDVRLYQRRIREDPKSAADLAQLALLYLQRGRETSDPADYAAAEDAAHRSLNLREAHNGKALALYTSALLARHRFVAARQAAEQLVQDNPDAISFRAQLAEIQLELGDYAATRTSFDGLRASRTDLAVAPRMARWLEIQGKEGEAWRMLLAARTEALRRADMPVEQAAWFQLRVADIALRNGRLGVADDAIAAGLAARPGDPRLLAARARLDAARGDWGDVVRDGEAAGSGADIATHALVGDAWLELGEAARAEAAFDTAEHQAQLRPEPFNRQLYLFRLDHDRKVPETLAIVRQGIEQRRDVYGYDLLGWALYRAGQPRAAYAASRAARAMGTQDAMIYFHAAVIEHALGEVAAARADLRHALAINGHFLVPRDLRALVRALS